MSPIISPVSRVKKIMSSMPCRCAYALCAGVAVVTLIASGLVMISGSEAPATQTAYTAFRFPDDEKTLKEFSAQLERETQDLNDITPAAGGDVSPEDEIGPRMPESLKISHDKPAAYNADKTAADTAADISVTAKP